MFHFVPLLSLIEYSGNFIGSYEIDHTLTVFRTVSLGARPLHIPLTLHTLAPPEIVGSCVQPTFHGGSTLLRSISSSLALRSFAAGLSFLGLAPWRGFHDCIWVFGEFPPSTSGALGMLRLLLKQSLSVGWFTELFGLIRTSPFHVAWSLTVGWLVIWLTFSLRLCVVFHNTAFSAAMMLPAHWLRQLVELMVRCGWPSLLRWRVITIPINSSRTRFVQFLLPV